MNTTREDIRLREDRERTKYWKRWGPYLSERAWGSVREDYSPGGAAWDYFPHDHARSRAYRWNEDGLAGICDRHQRICFAIALWNRRDPILKERLFGLTGSEGNHGEDVKEYYFYADNTPTHSYMRYLYKYPHAAFPYGELVEENRRRGKQAPEYELVDTGVFAGNRYFDVEVEYAKADPDDILIRIRVSNRGPEAASIDVLPTVWFRNIWSWHDNPSRPSLKRATSGVELDDPKYGQRFLHCDTVRLKADTTTDPNTTTDVVSGFSRTVEPALLFTENETNAERVFGSPSASPYVKDAFHRFVVNDELEAVNPAERGTKAAARYALSINAGETRTLQLRLNRQAEPEFGPAFDTVFAARAAEADEFYETIIPSTLSDDARNVARQAFAGLLWSKQYYHFVVKQWLEGDAGQPQPPADRQRGRNREWTHLYNSDVISMPDKWEYPWYAAWDLAFHCVPLALVDPDFAKDQLTLLLREWYMHPNGQLPAYEWALGDVNPPVHAWSAWRVYKIEQKRRGKGDLKFLERAFHKLLLNFTWWVNRKDAEGMNVFQGGFLGLDNIGVFDRSAPLPTGGHLEQSDGTSWMAMYSLNMLAIALELGRHNPAYEDVASKFWEHFLNIAHAIGGGAAHGGAGHDLWDDEDGFFYDVLHLPDDSRKPLKVRSLVGLIPLLAVQTLEPDMLERHEGFRRRLDWFVEHRPDLTKDVACMQTPGRRDRRLLAIVDGDQLRRILRVMLDEKEFLSPYGIRSISRVHQDQPYVLRIDGQEYRVDYEPAESTTGLFGGNSNWRGPIWFPINFLLVEALQKFHHYFGDGYTVECPTGSGRMLTLADVAAEISRRLTRIFLDDANGRRPVFGGNALFQTDPGWHDLIPFPEYFNGDTGAAVGASHQTGWTALVAKLLQQSGETDESDRSSTGRPNSVYLAELAKPSLSDIPGGRGILVKVLRVGVDGTDKEINAADYGAAPSGYGFLVIGHEGFGQVEEVGPNVSFIRPGDFVVATVRRPGKSIYDAIGLQDMTTDTEYFERGINLRHGYLTEYYVEDEEFVVKIPRGLQDVGVLLEPMTVAQKGITQAYEIQRRLKVWRPRRAAVMGAGTLGLLATLVLRLRGIEVTTFGRTPRPYLNADLLETIGARYVNTAEQPILDGARELGSFDLIFEGTGSSAVVFESMQVLARNGVLVLTSITGGNHILEVPADRINLEFVLGNKVMVGSVNASRENFETGVRDMSQAEAEYPGWLRRLLTHPVRGLERYDELFARLQNPNGAIKIFCEVSPS